MLHNTSDLHAIPAGLNKVCYVDIKTCQKGNGNSFFLQSKHVHYRSCE